MNEKLKLDPKRTALVMIDLVNDSISEGGFETENGGPTHAKKQNIIENVKQLANACRKAGIPVIHNHAKSLPGTKKNSPAFAAFATDELQKDYLNSWGAAPVEGLEPQPGEHVMDRTRINAFYGTRLDIVLRGYNADTIIITGAYTHHTVQHTARHGADAGYDVIVVADGSSSVNDEYHNSALYFGLSDLATVVNTQELVTAIEG